MNGTTGLRILTITCAIVALIALPATSAWASSTNILYGFTGGTDGEYTDTDLVLDSAGNIYGTSVSGGAFGSGTVFRVTPAGKHTVLYSFHGGTDGGEPYKGVTLDSQGNIYGTAVTGGKGACEGGCGVVFQLTKSGTNWKQTILYYFTGGNDGSGPGTGLTLDSNGNLYGMTPTAGAYGVGVVFQLKRVHMNAWEFKVIHTFTGGNDGAAASAGRLLIRNGHIYGVATAGGAHGKGAAFELTPSTVGEWHVKVLYGFKGQPDAGFPYGALSADKSGNLYGTTYYDGANNLGSVYELIPDGHGNWSEKVLYSFKGGSDGASSLANLVFDTAGNLYGTTSEGGAGCSCGVIFKLASDGHGNWSESIPHRFQGSPDGAFPYNGMVAGAGGYFYGATVHGGPTNDGAIYRFKP